MKKIFTTVLSLVFLLSMGTVAFATTQSGPTDKSTVTIKKEYKLTNEGTISPAEMFEFTIVRTSVTDAGTGTTVANMPIATIGTVTYAKNDATISGTTKNLTVTLPTYESVGIYTYTIKEKDGLKAGVTYFEDDITLVVTVIQTASGLVRIPAVHTEGEGEDATKTDIFPNEYSAGDIQIKKTVTGNLGDKEKFFDVVVTLTGVVGKKYDNPYVVSGGSNTENPETITVGTPATFKLKGGETIEIANLPYGVTYTVVETDYTGEGYDTAVYDFGDTAKKINSALDKVEITNNKTVDVDTGISLDSIPYFLILGFAILGSGVMFFRKRQNANF